MPEAILPETTTDEALLRRYAESREPEAFAELARRHAGLVYGTCLRITASPHDAEELAQDCFFQLARQAGAIRTSVAGWLHRLATHRALNAQRSRGRRRVHEARAAREARPVPDDVPAWKEIEPLLDRAIADLPEALRAAIVLHFLENRPQGEVAAQLGVNQSTISRRIREGLARLQRQLRRSGIALSAAPLATLLSANAHQAGQPDLLAAIGKIALAGGAAVGPAAAAGAGGLGFAGVKLSSWAMAGLTALGPILVQLIAGGWHGFLAAAAILLYIGLRQPAWLDDFNRLQGGDRNFLPLRRWTWTTPPARWRGALAGALLAGLLLLGMAITILRRNPSSPGTAAWMLVFSALPLATALRIISRIRNAPVADKAEVPKDDAPAPDAITVAQFIGLAVVSILMLACMATVAARHDREEPVLRGILPFMAIASLGICADAVFKIIRFLRSPRPAPSPAPPGKAIGGVVYMLVPAAFLSLFAFLGPEPAANALRRDIAGSFIPMMSLFSLAIAAGPLARLRPTTSSLAWCSLVAITLTCATADVCVLASWLTSLT